MKHTAGKYEDLETKLTAEQEYLQEMIILTITNEIVRRQDLKEKIEKALDGKELVISENKKAN